MAWSRSVRSVPASPRVRASPGAISPATSCPRLSVRTRAGKDEVLQRNAVAQPDRTARCVYCGEKLTKPAQSQKGVTPPETDAQVDHVDPKANSGSGDPSNGAGACRVCNNRKSDNVP